MAAPALAIHGGAGLIARGDQEFLALARAGLGRALRSGTLILEQGGPALLAVEAAVRVLEDDPCFNAGRGSALTSEGRVEMDAALVDGATGRAGALAGVTTLRHPISAARLLLERGPHVLMAGPGAERHATALGAETIDPALLITPRALEQLERFRQSRVPASQGTVGAVACDTGGRLAAATSTGGTTGKLPGRIGDSPVIGAGTWADARCAVSATGLGEAFLRTAFAHALASRIAAGIAADEAAHQALALVRDSGGNGGCIVVTRTGVIVTLQDDDMFRASWSATQPARVAIFRDD